MLKAGNMVAMFFIFLPLGFMLDYYFWKKLTPCIITFVGVYFISLTYELFGSSLGFIEINVHVYYYILTFYLLGLTASLSACAITTFVYKINSPVQKFTLFTYGENSKRFIISLAIGISFMCLYFIFSAYRELGSFVSEDFEGKLTYGFAGHSFALLMATLPFLVEIYLKENRKKILILIVAILCLLFMKQVKYWVMIPLVWMVWYVVSAKFIHLSVKKYFSLSLKLIISLLLLFFSVYFMKVVMSNDTAGLSYSAVIFSILIHFFGYLFSGILTLSSYENMGFFTNLSINDGFGLFAGFFNIFNALTGSELMNLALNRPMVSLNILYPSAGNVPSLWGTLLLAAGNASFLFFFSMIFFLSLLSGFSAYSKGLLLVYTFLSSFLFFSWFDYYYYLLTPYEVSVYILIVYSIIRAFRIKEQAALPQLRFTDDSR